MSVLSLPSERVYSESNEQRVRSSEVSGSVSLYVWAWLELSGDEMKWAVWRQAGVVVGKAGG